jgi:hypothetical protein
MKYEDISERQRRQLIWIADSIVDNNPLCLLRLKSIRTEDVLPLHSRISGLFATRPVYYEQVFNALRDNNMLYLIEEAQQ